METVIAWWQLMCGLAALNLVLLGLVVRAYLRAAPGLAPAARARARTKLVLAALFTVGCASRSVVIRADVQRMVMIDHWFASVAVGRSIATVAELAFMALLALVLRETARGVGATGVVRASYAVVPMIAVAEGCSWYAVATTNYLGNVVEESTWALTAALMIACVAAMWGRLGPAARRVAGPCALLGLGYVAFMVTVDVPMYATRWAADQAAGRAYLDLAGGFRDVATRWSVSFDLAAWRGEMPWMTLYFSVSVWASLLLARPPRANRATMGETP